MASVNFAKYSISGCELRAGIPGLGAVALSATEDHAEEKFNRDWFSNMNDDLQRPAAPNFIRRTAVAVGIAEPTTDIRSAEERARVARANEEKAKSAVATATTERIQAEKALGPARQAAQQEATTVNRQETERLDRLQEQLDRVIARVKADDTRPQVALRLRCRVFLHGGGAGSLADGEPSNPSATLHGILTMDPIAGALYEVVRVGGQLMHWCIEQGADDQLYARADDLEFAGWSSMIERI